MFTPLTNNQNVEAVNLTTCDRCGAKPTEWCKTNSGYIAQEEHASRRIKLQQRKANPPPAPEWVPIVPSKAMVITIEVIVPRDPPHGTGAMLNEALTTLRTGEGFADVTNLMYVEQDMEEAAQILKMRRVVDYADW